MAPTFNAVSTLFSDRPLNCSVRPLHLTLMIPGAVKVATS